MPGPTSAASGVPGAGGPLSAREVTVRAGAQTLLGGVSFSLHPGELCALIGPSGAGKSTLIKVLLGVRRPEQGQVRLAQRQLAEHGPVGYVPQRDALHSMLSVDRALHYGALLRLPQAQDEERRRRIAQVLGQVGLSERRSLRTSRLSGGQQKRLSVALELLLSPSLLILDEPTSGLDPGLEAQLMRLFLELAHGGRIVLVATHAMESLDLCQALLLLVEGRVAYFGPPREALAYFGVDRYAAIFRALSKRRGGEWAEALRGDARCRAFAARGAPTIERGPR